MRFLSILIVAAGLPAATYAQSFNFTITSSSAQFPGAAQAAVFGNTTGGTETLSLTPNVPAQLGITNFTNFFPFDVFLHNYPANPTNVASTIASTTFTQTITVNGVSQTVSRTASQIYNSAAVGTCNSLLSLSPVLVTIDLGSAGKVDVNLNNAPIGAVNCTPPFNGTLNNPLTI